MHQVIHAIVDAQTREDTIGVARESVFDRLVVATRDSRREFDSPPRSTPRGPGASRTGMECTKAEFERNLQHVRDGLADLSDEQIMSDTNFVQHHCANLGTHVGPPIHLYNEFGNGIRTPEDFVFAHRDFDEPWIVPVDVHF